MCIVKKSHFSTRKKFSMTMNYKVNYLLCSYLCQQSDIVCYGCWVIQKTLFSYTLSFPNNFVKETHFFTLNIFIIRVIGFKMTCISSPFSLLLFYCYFFHSLSTIVFPFSSLFTYCTIFTVVSIFKLTISLLTSFFLHIIHFSLTL
jgi:hypothetical protein